MNNVLIVAFLEKVKSSLIQSLSFSMFLYLFSILSLGGISQQNG